MKKAIKMFLVIFGLCVLGGMILGISEDLSNETTAQTTAESKDTFYKPAVEDYITTYLGLSNPSYSFSNYREWDDGAGFIMVENTYEVNDVEHSYIARVGKDNVIYKLTVDGEVLFSADADALMEYMEKYQE